MKTKKLNGKPKSLSRVGLQRMVRLPIKANLTMEATSGTPALAGMLAHLLIVAGATVTLGDERITIPSKLPNLKGLETREVDWSDEHPLNQKATADAAYRKLFES